MLTFKQILWPGGVMDNIPDSACSESAYGPARRIRVQVPFGPTIFVHFFYFLFLFTLAFLVSALLPYFLPSFLVNVGVLLPSNFEVLLPFTLIAAQ